MINIYHFLGIESYIISQLDHKIILKTYSLYRPYPTIRLLRNSEMAKKKLKPYACARRSGLAILPYWTMVFNYTLYMEPSSNTIALIQPISRVYLSNGTNNSNINKRTHIITCACPPKKRMDLDCVSKYRQYD